MAISPCQPPGFPTVHSVYCSADVDGGFIVIVARAGVLQRFCPFWWGVASLLLWLRGDWFLERRCLSLLLLWLRALLCASVCLGTENKLKAVVKIQQRSSDKKKEGV